MANNEVKVSVIIPTHNRQRVICETIESVFAQTYQNLEIIVVDDGSIDDTAQILGKYGTNIKYIFQENKGIAAARNRGIKEAAGEYVALLDSDDVWLPKKLETQMNYLRLNNRADLVCCKAEVIDSEGKAINVCKPSKYNSADFDGLLRDKFVVTSSVLVKKSVVEKAGCFDEELVALEDFELWLRLLLLNYKFYFIDCPLLRYRLSSDSESKNLFNFYSTAVQVYRKLLRYCKKEQEKKIITYCRKDWYMLSKEHLNQGRILSCLKYYLMSKFLVKL